MTADQKSVILLKARWFGDEDDVFAYASEAEARQGVREYFQYPDDTADFEAFEAWLEGEDTDEPRGYFEFVKREVSFAAPPQLPQLQQELAVTTLQARWCGQADYDVYVCSSVAEARQEVREYFECPRDVTDFDEWLSSPPERQDRYSSYGVKGHYEITTHQTLLPASSEVQQLRKALSELVAHVDSQTPTPVPHPDDLTMKAYQWMMSDGFDDEYIIEIIDAERLDRMQKAWKRETIDVVQTRLQSFEPHERERLKLLDCEQLACAILYPSDAERLLKRSADEDALAERVFFALTQRYGEIEILEYLSDGSYQDVITELVVEAVRMRLQAISECQPEELENLKNAQSDDELEDLVLRTSILFDC